MPTTTISLARLAELLKAEERLLRLERGGVDNWEWYGDSVSPDGEESIYEFEDKIDAKVEDGTLTP